MTGAADPTFHSTDLVPVTVLATASIVYLLYHYGASDRSWAARLAGPARRGEDLAAAAAFARRLSGAVLLGGVPLAVGAALGYSPAALGLGVGRPGIALASAAGLAIAVLPIVARASRRPAMLELYPELRVREWTPARVRANALTWTLYLLGYEILFRGFLLVPLVDHLGTWPAIAVNTALYVAVHLTKEAGEATGTLVMGVVFAWMALAGGSIWAPFALHVAIALTSDTVARRATAGG